MFEYLIFYEIADFSNYPLFNEFLDKIKNKLLSLSSDSYTIHSIINIINIEEEKLIQFYTIIASNIKYIQLAFIKKIINKWLDNITNYNKYIFETIDMYYAFYDIMFYYDENQEINFDMYDGNYSCDITINLTLTHIIIKHTLYLLQEQYPNFSFICNKITKNYRCGIYINLSNTEIINSLLEMYEYHDNNLYIFLIPSLTNFTLNCFNHTSAIIQNEIKMKIPWIIEKLYYLFNSLDIINHTFNFFGILSNLIEKFNYYKKIEDDFNSYIEEIKKFKEIIYNLNNTIKLNHSIEITKRLQIKERKIRNKKT